MQVEIKFARGPGVRLEICSQIVSKMPGTPLPSAKAFKFHPLGEDIFFLNLTPWVKLLKVLVSDWPRSAFYFKTTSAKFVTSRWQLALVRGHW